MLRRLPILLTALAALAMPAAAPAAEIGLNMNGGAAASTADNWSMLDDTRTGWARHFVVWSGQSATDGGYDDIVAQEERRGIKTLFVVTGLGGARADSRYAAFVGSLAARYKGKVDAYEIWNEADEPAFWPGAPDPAGYVSLLKQSYTAIKAADPAAKVVFSPLTGNNYGFVDAAYAAGAKGYFDVMAVHTDTACLVAGPTEFYREDGRIARFVFLGYRTVRETMLAHGDEKPIWMTEFGWSATNRTCDRGRWAGQKAAGVSEEQQAQYLREAYHCMKEDPYVEVAMWFNSRDLRGDGSELDSYGLRRADGSRRPAYDAFKDVVRGVDTVTGPCGDFVAPTVDVQHPRPGFMFGDRDRLYMRAASPDQDVKRITFAYKAANGTLQNLSHHANENGLPLDFTRGLPSFRWFGALKLPFGDHTIVVLARDYHDNETRIEIPVKKVNPATLAPQPARVQELAVSGSGTRRTIRGEIISGLPFAISGRVRVEWQTRRQGRWKKVHGGSRNAHRPFVFHQTLKYAGRWRVRVVYDGKRPYRRTRSCWVYFSTSSAKVRPTCGTGLKSKRR
ncbi:MAG TPA: glycosyl hydrolase [Solirubrobacteraceae bacterium]|nr:glycosyl hydrolase [Solirubrobacteraceae bacterium]